MVHLSAADIAYQKAHITDDRRDSIIVSHAICIALAFVAVVLRFISRKIGEVKIHWDDYMTVAAFVFALGEVIGGFLAVRFGGAKHAILLKDPETFAKVVIATEVLYNPGIACVKFSCLLLYRRVFPSRRFHIILYTIGTIIFIYSWLIMITAVFQCSPIRAAWDMSIENPKCIKFSLEVVIFAVLNSVTDVLTICLPMPMLWRLKLPLEKRIQLMGVFCAGGFVCVVSIYRVPKEAQLSLKDAPWSDVDAAVWSVVEVCLGIVGACLPTYRPLFLRLIGDNPRPFSLRKLKSISWPTSHSSKGDVSRATPAGANLVKLGPRAGGDGYSVRSEDERKSPEPDMEKPLPSLVPWHGEEKSEILESSRARSPSPEWIV